MPNTKISGLTAGNPAQSGDEIPIARAGANFKVTAASIAALSPAGTVTSVGGTGTVNGITLTGTVTSSGNLTLGGTLSGINLATQVTGTLPTNRGGTNLTSFSGGGAMYASDNFTLTTGTLPLTAGGTGQTTKAAAFNALSPVTSTGDLIIGNGSNSNTRLAIGTNGYVLTSDGSTASWQPAGGGGGSLIGITDSSGFYRTFLGQNAGNNASADSSTYIGAFSGNQATSSSDYNTAVGLSSMQNSSSAQYCAVLGYQAATGFSLGNFTTAVGAFANGSTSGVGNTAIGYQALNFGSTVQYDVAIGYNSSSSHSFSGSSYNTVIGTDAGSSQQMGSYNVLIGYNAQPDAFQDNGGIVIGDTSNITKFVVPSLGLKAEYTSTDSGTRKSRFRSYTYFDGSQSQQFVSGSQQLDLGKNTSFNLYLTGSTSISLTGTVFESGTSQTFLLFLYSNGNSVSWSFSPIWAGGTPPTLSATGTDLFVFRRDNNTGQVYGAKAGTF